MHNDKKTKKEKSCLQDMGVSPTMHESHIGTRGFDENEVSAKQNASQNFIFFFKGRAPDGACAAARAFSFFAFFVLCMYLRCACISFFIANLQKIS